jgi:hypothetical protein
MAFPELAAAPTAEEMEGKAMHFDEAPAPESDYINPQMFIDGAADCATDEEAAKFWKDNNFKLSKQPADYAAFKAAIIARRTALKNAKATDVQDKREKTFDQVMAMLTNAENIDKLYVAGDWIGDVSDPEERSILSGKFDELKNILEAA